MNDMATVDFGELRTGDLIALGHERRFRVTRIVGEITRIDRDYNRICVDGYILADGRLEESEFWFIDYAYVKRSERVEAETFRDMRGMHASGNVSDCVKEIFGRL